MVKVEAFQMEVVEIEAGRPEMAWPPGWRLAKRRWSRQRTDGRRWTRWRPVGQRWSRCMLNGFWAKGSFFGPFISVDAPRGNTSGNQAGLPVVGDECP